MNWIQKIAQGSPISTGDIAFAVAAGISSSLPQKGTWKTRGGRRDWSAWNRHRAVFKAVIVGRDIQGSPLSEEPLYVKLFMIYTLPFSDSHQEFGSAVGLTGLELEGIITVSTNDYWHDEEAHLFQWSGPIVETPADMAKWVVNVINGDWTPPGRGFDNNDDDDDPISPLFPEFVDDRNKNPVGA
jgi:hypothetical protein